MENVFNSKRASKGNIAIWILFAWLLMIMILLSSFLIENYLLNIKAQKVRTAIVVSNLAIYKNIDLQALGDTPSKFKISDPYSALSTFKTYIEKNLNLDSTMNAYTNSVAIGLVKIKMFNIYNIDGNTCQIYTYDYNSDTFSSTTNNDITTTPVICPTGQTVKKTAVYSMLDFSINFLMKGVIGNSKEVTTGALTDITY